MKNLLLDVSNGIGVLKINREDKLNALNLETIEELYNTLKDIENDNSIRCVIFTGSGKKAFIAGADISYMKSITPLEAYHFSRLGQKCVRYIAESKKVYIATVNGYALGGGFEMALGCDFIYASKNAKFGFPEVTLGIFPGFGGTQNLSRITGKNVANELIFTGKTIDADYAKSLNVVLDVKDSVDELLDFSKKTAEKIIENGLVGISLAKRAINDGFNLTYDEALKYESGLFGVVFSTYDAKEGLNAFVEKRKPVFKGV